MPREFEINTYRAHHTSFYMFVYTVGYLVKSSNDFTANTVGLSNIRCTTLHCPDRDLYGYWIQCTIKSAWHYEQMKFHVKIRSGCLENDQKIRVFILFIVHCKGVGTAGATGALAPAILKLRGQKYLFAPAIICQVYQLVDSETSNF